MFRSTLLTACLLFTTLSASVSALTLAEMGIAADGHSRLRNPDGSILRVKFTPPPKPVGRAAVAQRQTSREEIAARKMQRPKWKKAYNSIAACGGYAGQNIHLLATADGVTSYVTSDGFGPTLGGGSNSAVSLTMSGDCNLVTNDGRIANIIASVPSSIYFDTPQDIAYYDYKKLVCSATPDKHELQCAAFGVNTFCTDNDDQTSFFLAETCMNLVTLSVTVVD